MKFSNSFLFVVTLLGTVILFFFLLYRPANNVITYLRGQIIDGQQRKHEEEIVTRAVAEKEKAHMVLTREVNSLKSGLLQPNEHLPLMKALRSLCNEMGLRNESISPKGQESRDDFEVVIVEVRLKGEFKEIYSFIVRLEDLEVTVQIDNIELLGEPRTGDWIQANLKLSAPIAGI